MEKGNGGEIGTTDEEEELYDEFGNYIGPDIDSDDDSDSSNDDSDGDEGIDGRNDGDGNDSISPSMTTMTMDKKDVHDDNATAVTEEGGVDGSVGGSRGDDSTIGGGVVGVMEGRGGGDGEFGDDGGIPSSTIILHEDKDHYPSASELYGPGVNTAVLDEDAMDIDTPILAPVPLPVDDEGPEMIPDVALLEEDVTMGAQKSKADTMMMDVSAPKFFGGEDMCSESYLLSILSERSTQSLRRGLALVGDLGCGKTSIVDLLVECTRRELDAFGSAASMERRFPSGGGRGRGTGGAGGKEGADEKGGGGGGVRVTDTLPAERARGMSLRTSPITLALPDRRGKTHVVTIMDCPGHVQFHDESALSLSSADGAVFVLDAINGVNGASPHVEMLVRRIVQCGLPLILVVSRVDRLLLELKLPPEDCYCKLRRVVEEFDGMVQTISSSMGTKRKYPKISPDRGNVLFASATHGWCFGLLDFANMHLDHLVDDISDDDDSDEERVKEKKGSNNGGRFSKAVGLGGQEMLGRNLPPEAFAARLWGDCFLDPHTRRFYKKSSKCVPSNTARTFITHVLEPLYKIYTTCLGESSHEVGKTLRCGLGIMLAKDQLREGTRTLLRATFRRFMDGSKAFAGTVLKNIPSPVAASPGKVARCYTGSPSSSLGKAMSMCDPDGPLAVHVTKLLSSLDGRSHSALGRIYSGTIKEGEKVRVLGEGYSPEDEEDASTATITAISIPRPGGRTKIRSASAGNWVLIDGVDANIAKTATIVGINERTFGNNGHGVDEDDTRIFAPPRFPGGEAVVKLAVEPLNPAELPKMVEGLRRVSKSYPALRTKVEESGEHVVFGTGELYLDNVMHDLRCVHADIEVKVADPVVAFRETVGETSAFKCHSETANKRNRITMIAEPLDEGLAEVLETGKVNPDWDNKKMGRYFKGKYDWDLLSARSVWAFGPDSRYGPNLLLDDTLPNEVDGSLLGNCKSGIIQGFQWATREGPLCEEPVRSSKIKILEAVLADRPVHRGGGQIIPAARRVVHSSILSATPKLMEPIYRLSIQCPGEIIDAIRPALTKRRGHISGQRPIPGAPLSIVDAFVPVIDSFGFETDLRTFTQGQAMVHAVFDHWAIVPGNPLDKDVVLNPLEPSPIRHLAREFLIKTRRRKGLSDDVSSVKFFDSGISVGDTV